MRLGTILKLALLLNVAFGSSANAKALVRIGFCQDLKAVVADAPNDFAKYRGHQRGATETDVTGYRTTKFTALRHLAGAARCSVEDHLAPDDKKPRTSYICEWLPSGTKIDAVSEVAVAARNCVGESPDDEFTTYKDGSAVADIYRETYSINVSSGSVPQIFMVIRRQ